MMDPSNSLLCKQSVQHACWFSGLGEASVAEQSAFLEEVLKEKLAQETKNDCLAAMKQTFECVEESLYALLEQNVVLDKGWKEIDGEKVVSKEV